MNTEKPADETLIRPATTTDLDQVESLLAPFVAQRKLLPRTTEELAKLLANGFVAEHSGQIVGFAAVEAYSRKLAELQCVAVAELHQGQGIGRRLVRQCTDRARELGVNELLAISASEEMLKSCGFDYSLPDQKRALFFQTGNRV